MSITKQELKNRWWYRLIVVVYIIFTVAVIIGLSIFSWIERPTQVINHQRSTINCKLSGESFNFSELGIYYSVHSLGFDSYNEGQARERCAAVSGYSGQYERYGINKTEDVIEYRRVSDYAINLITELDQSWISWFTITFFVLLIVLVIMLLIRQLFMYIVVGKFWI